MLPPHNICRTKAGFQIDVTVLLTRAPSCGQIFENRFRGGMDTDISGRQQRRRTSGGVFFRTARFRYHLNDEQVAARDQIIDDNFCQFQERFQIFFTGI